METNTVTDSTMMPFGKYKNKKTLANVPAVYLLWLYENGCDHRGVMQYIQRNLDVLRKEASAAKRR
ncbi:DUF3820 family protein [Chitinophaga sp. CC14]|uniref:putative quorum-sensing-regulated virulence factor n=1 Tax=Chitinophaga sp. CC14 TaxID=3029199 RepID=UPI003B7636CA